MYLHGQKAKIIVKKIPMIMPALFATGRAVGYNKL